MKDKDKKTKPNAQKAVCALKGTSICPKPKECDGLKCKCTVWKSHSAK